MKELVLAAADGQLLGRPVERARADGLKLTAEPDHGHLAWSASVVRSVTDPRPSSVRTLIISWRRRSSTRHSLFAGRGQPGRREPADDDRACSRRERLDDIRTGPDAAVQQDLDVRTHSVTSCPA